MAQFVVDGQPFSVNREAYKRKVVRSAISSLEMDLVNLGELEKAYAAGVLICKESDWDELVGIAQDIANELGMRSLLQSCGITKEVR
jgi:hypothetical protein